MEQSLKATFRVTHENYSCEITFVVGFMKNPGEQVVNESGKNGVFPNWELSGKICLDGVSLPDCLRLITRMIRLSSADHSGKLSCQRLSNWLLNVQKSTFRIEV